MTPLDQDETWFSPVCVSSKASAISIRPGGLCSCAILGLFCAISLMPACKSEVRLASWQCPQPLDSSLLGAAGAPADGGTSDAFALPWSTGFEDSFCDYEDGRGSCYTTDSGQYKLVSEPVHSGDFAAAFTVKTTEDNKQHQVRCTRVGSLPTAGYYSAWYYVPALIKSPKLWNLFFFQGDKEAINGGHLWSISLVNKDNGDLRLVTFSYLPSALPDQTNNPSIPIRTWFHIKVYLKRATDETGEVIVYQDDVVVFQMTNVVTDNSSAWAQWYVGNLAQDSNVQESTLYVDDISMSETP